MRRVQYQRNRHLAHTSVSVRMICNMGRWWWGEFFSTEASHVCDTHVCTGNCVRTEKPKDIQTPHSTDVVLMMGKATFLLSDLGEMLYHTISY